MQKFTLQALVIEYKGKIQSVEGLNDVYTRVQPVVSIDSDDLGSLALLKKNNPCTADSIQRLFDYGYALNLGEQEAKDFTGDYGNVRIRIVNVPFTSDVLAK